MIITTKLLTGAPAPFLEVSTLEHQTWRLPDQHPQNFTMIVFYRGSHCPLCKNQLLELEANLVGFNHLGIQMIAISGDSLERAQKSYQDWGLKQLLVGWGLSVVDMRQWGLYISKGAYANEPAFFNEPAIFLIRPDGLVNTAFIGSSPFARPHATDLLGGIDYILKNKYPIRGTQW